MRRASALLAVPLIAAAAFVAGCSSKPADPNASVSVSGKFGAAPKVTIPAKAASSTLYTKTLIKGKGAPVASGGATLDNYSVYDWSGKTHKLMMSTYSQHMPQLMPSNSMPGLAKALKGAKAGSRILAVIPPKQGIGAMGSQGAEELGVKPTDSLVFVLDVSKTIGTTATGKQVSSGGGSLPKVNTPAAGQEPTITIPKSSPPKKLTSTTLIKGSGAKVTSGENLLVQYTGVNWTTGKVFDASYKHGGATEMALTTGSQTQSGVIPGFVKGLAGQTVGSRVLLTIPPSDGYGKQGQPQAGIKGTDTLAFVVDILYAGKGAPTS